MLDIDTLTPHWARLLEWKLLVASKEIKYRIYNSITNLDCVLYTGGLRIDLFYTPIRRLLKATRWVYVDRVQRWWRLYLAYQFWWFDLDFTDCKTIKIGHTVKHEAVLSIYNTRLEDIYDIKYPRLRRKIRRLTTRSQLQKLSNKGKLRVAIRYRAVWYKNKRLRRTKWFRKRLRKWQGRFRRINKSAAYNRYIRIHFYLLTGLSESDLFRAWRESYKKGRSNSWGGENLLVQKFHQLVLLSPVYFILLLRLAPSIAAAQCLIRSGMLIINGQSRSSGFISIKPGDLVQVNYTAMQVTRQLFTFQAWKTNFQNILGLQFLYIDWSLNMFVLVRQPYLHELTSPTFLSERWLRYYIRQFPRKIKYYRPINPNWHS
jgi:hypothetical protein